MALLSNKNYDELEQAYDDISIQTSISGAATQLGVMGMDFINRNRTLNSINPRRTSGIKPTRVNLKRTDILPETQRAVDKYVNTMIQRAREENRPTGELSAILAKGVDAYYEGVSAQLKADTETYNQEGLINAQMEQQTKQVNASIEAQNDQMEYDAQLKKAQLYTAYNDKIRNDLMSITAIMNNAAKSRFAMSLDMKTRMEEEKEQARIAKIEARLMNMREESHKWNKDWNDLYMKRFPEQVAFENKMWGDTEEMNKINITAGNISNAYNALVKDYLKNALDSQKAGTFSLFNNRLNAGGFGGRDLSASSYFRRSN